MQNLPELEESKKSLRFAIFQTLGIAFLIIVGILVFSNISIKNTITTEKKDIENNLVQIVSLVRKTIEPEIASYRNGSLTRDEAIDIIVIKLRNMTYEDKYGLNYVFLITYDGYIKVQPYQPWLENTNQLNMRDTNGKYLIRAIINDARASETGAFVSYYYKPPNLEEEEEKISYVVDIPDLDVVIGTGMYMRLYYEDQTLNIQRVMLTTLLVACLVLLITLSALQRISSTSKKLEKEIIARGEAQINLEVSESNLRTVFDSISDAFFVHKEDGEVIEVNDRVLSMFGCAREEIVGKKIFQLATPENVKRDRLAEIFSHTMRGETFVQELNAIRMDTKKAFNIEAAMQAGTWYGEKVILAVVRDIQKRKFIERELLHSQMLNEHAEEMGQLGHYSIDMKTQNVSWSKGLYKIFQRDMALPAPDHPEYYSMIVSGNVDRIKQLRAESYEKIQSYDIEYKVRRGDGEIRDLYVKVGWLPEGDDPRRYLIGSVQDVTDRNLAVEEIRQREEKFRTTIQQMTDGLVILDEDGRIIEWNSSCVDITGIQSEQALGSLIWDLFSSLSLNSSDESFFQNLKNELDTAGETGQSQYFDVPREMYIRTISGQSRILLQTIFPIQTSTTFRLGIILHDITEQKAALNKINHELKKLASLRSIDAAILERVSPSKTLELICSIAVDLLDVDGAIILSRMAQEELKRAYISRIDTPEEPLIAQLFDLQIAAIEKLNTRILTGDDLEMINTIQQLDPSTGHALRQAILPLLINKQVCGYIQVFSRKPFPDDQEWADYFLTLAGQTSLAVENVILITNEEFAYKELNHAYEATIAGWSKALELRDEETQGHSDRVMNLACKLARMAHYPEDSLTAFRRGVLLHDIGKMGIPDRILFKPGALDSDEWSIMKQHPCFAFDLLSSIPYLTDSLDIPYLHHERWDGSGYPKGLKGKDIPLGARIFAIVDVWDALISDRPYRKGWPVENTRQYLLDNKNVLFDPELVDLFLDLIDHPEKI